MLLLVNLCFLLTSGYVVGKCNKGCNEPTLFYEGLNCKPIFASPRDCCPSHYDCGHIEARTEAKEEKCYFQGKAYKLKENIPGNNNCAGCSCEMSSGGMAINCPIVDCPELWNERKPGCHYKQEFNQCCAEDQICPPFATKCEVGEKTYYEGMYFDAPNKKCTSCICQNGFNGTFEEPFCKKDSCAEELYNQEEVYNFCAPIFTSLDACCPIGWKCPEEEDVLVIDSEMSLVLPSLASTCKYGKESLKVGFKLERSTGRNRKITCECRIPPYLTCIEKSY